MKIKDFMKTLSSFDPEIELVIDVNGEFVTPSVQDKVVYFKHDYSGTTFKDEAVVLAN